MTQSALGYFQEIDIQAPITPDELFTDQDYEIIAQDNTDGSAITTNLYWRFFQKYLGNSAYIHNKVLHRRILEYMNDTFTIPIMPRSEVTQGGGYVFPATLVCFSENNWFHREGHTPDIYKNRHRLDAHLGRIDYALNFKMIGSEENSGTFFGEPNDDVIEWERIGADHAEAYHRKYLTHETETTPYYYHMVNGQPAWQYRARHADFLPHPDVNQHDYITTVAKKEDYDYPYFINLAKYHRVDMCPSIEPRMSLRIHCDWKRFTFDEVQRLHLEGKLLK